jgi:hypothetical protein
MDAHEEHAQHMPTPEDHADAASSPGAKGTLTSLPPLSAVTRRALLKGTALLGGLAFLQGCGGSRLAENFPQPVWPDQEPLPQPAKMAYTVPNRPPVIAQQAPAPQVQVAPSSVAVIGRTAWTREQPKWKMSKPMNGVHRITVHHDALEIDGRGQNWSVSRLNKIRRAHLSRGSTWVDIGYHYIIDPDGRVWEGRPINIEGAHVASTNDHNVGVMCMGNFERDRPTQAQLYSLDMMVADLMRRYRVPMGRVATHQELKPTECPGNNLQSYMRQTRSSRGRLASLT